MMYRLSFAAAIAVLVQALSGEAGAGQGNPVLFPRDHSIVAGTINVIIDAEPDRSPGLIVQITVGNERYPSMDVSAGPHAVQKVVLAPGLNTITVTYLEKERRSEELKELATQEITVYSAADPLRVGPAPKGFHPAPFHLKEHEARCSGCHPMEAAVAGARNGVHKGNACLACHRTVISGAFVHDPSAAGNCLACHDPASAPARYDVPSSSTSGDAVARLCSTCHAGKLARGRRHGPAEAGFCTLCHNPHAGARPVQLRATAQTLCTVCHAESPRGRCRDKTAGASAGISGNHGDTVTESCIGCHKTHCSDSDKFLLVGTVGLR